jgi:hypothetical protein
MSESNKVKKRFVRSSVAIILCASALGQSQPESSPSPNSMSPDKKWQYVSGVAPKIVQAGSTQVALDLSEECHPGDSPENPVVLWAPDSRRLAFYCGQGKQRLTLLYQLRAEGWVALQTPGDGDELFERVGKIIEGQAKRKGPPKKTFLHMQWWAVDPQRWLDARTLSMHVSMAEVLHRDNGEFVGPGFRADLLLTLEFNDAGDWKIVKTHQMSEKESKKFEY